MATAAQPPELAKIATPPDIPLVAAEAVEAVEPPPPPDAAPLTAEPVAQGATVHDTPAAPRINLDTVAQLSAELARKLDARVTRFDIELTPDGLGEVSVAIEIGADGDVSAHLGFERPEIAVELRGRADELRQALEDAGFSVGGQALSFGEGRRPPQTDAHAAGSRRSAVTADATASLPVPQRRAIRAGVDLRV